jgi:hypothetical protein
MATGELGCQAAPDGETQNGSHGGNSPRQLTERDLKILSHVARHRFLSSRHLARLDGGSEQNLLRCLRVLFDHQFLDRPTPCS